jgi:pyruvate/2-oxoglutarate dehydrogenase complex dihydrolipoamide dehydrogenase (E3) component
MLIPSTQQELTTPRNERHSDGSLADRVERTLVENVHPPDWRNPKFAGRYDLIVIGAGPGGLAAAREAVALGAKVALIERDFIGGDRLNVGCVPSKAIIRTARLYADMRDAEKFGGRVPGAIEIDFQASMQRMRRIQARLSRADSAERLSEIGIDLYLGEARFLGSDTIAVSGETLRFKRALVATGSRPSTPPIPGLAEAGYLTNESVFNLNRCPRRLLVVGGGPVGCELAQAFCRFGSHVIIAQDDPTFLPKEERDAAQILSDALARDGVEIHLNTTVVAVRMDGAEKIVDLVCDDDKFSIPVDEILVGIGRAPNVENLNLGAAGVHYEAEAGIHVDDFLRTSNPRIYAAGDVCLQHKFTHSAEATARIAVRNALFLGRKRLSALTIPWCTYTDPEIAHVGLYIRESWAQNIAVRTFTILMHDVDRAVVDGEEEGFVKIHVKDGTDRILGATVVASHAGEMINGLSLAITAGIGLSTLAQVIHTYPTQAGAIKLAADAYNRTRLTPFRKFLAKCCLAW